MILVALRLGMGPDALPLSHAVTVSVECLVLVAVLRARLRGHAVLGTHLRAALAALAMGLCAFALRNRLPLVLVVAAAAATYAASGYVLGLHAFLRGRSPRR